MNGLEITLDDTADQTLKAQMAAFRIDAKTPLHVLDVLHGAGFEAFVETLAELDTPAARSWSRIIATRLAIAAAELALPEEFQQSVIKLMNDTRDAVRFGGSQIPMMRLAQTYGHIADSWERYANGSASMALGAVQDVFLEVGFTPYDTYDDEMLAEDAADSARRVFEALHCTVARCRPEVKAAARIAQLALDGEERWQKGTNTHFGLVAEPVNEAMYEIEETAFNDPATLAYLEKLCLKSCKSVIKAMERSR